MNRRVIGLMLAVMTCGLLAAPSAQATTVTIGSPGPASAIQAPIGGVLTVINLAIPGASVTSPGNGVITSWKIADAGGGPFSLQVVRPAAGGIYATAGSTSPETISGGGTLTFQANLPIAKGDLIGVTNSNSSGDHIGAAETSGASFTFFEPALGSDPRSPEPSNEGEIGFNAQVLLNCVVPSLKGKKVGAATSALAAAGCAPPTVTKAKGKKKGKFVKKQSPAAGTEIRGDAAVALKLGPKKKTKKK
jgi:PASTA domain-containing protein